jgi:hypothetical protein
LMPSSSGERSCSPRACSCRARGSTDFERLNQSIACSVGCLETAQPVLAAVVQQSALPQTKVDTGALKHARTGLSGMWIESVHARRATCRLANRTICTPGCHLPSAWCIGSSHCRNMPLATMILFSATLWQRLLVGHQGINSRPLVQLDTTNVARRRGQQPLKSESTSKAAGCS